jgi:alcohol dehydrogenase class IV
MDALTQLIEPFVSIRANPLTDALCREGISRAARALRRAFEQGSDAAAREDLSLASLFSGLALANAGLGAVHGITSVLGGMYPAAHGAICARLLSPVMDINLRAIQRRADSHPAWSRYVEVAQILTGSEKASPAQGVAWVQELCQELKIPPLREYSVSRADFPEIIEKSLAASSTKANPVRLTAEEMQEILELAWS